MEDENINIIAIETVEGDVVAPEDSIEIINSWCDSGITK